MGGRALLGLLLVLPLWAESFAFPDFKACVRKSAASFVEFSGTQAVAVGSHEAVAVGGGKALEGYTRYDPFLDLYLFATPQTLKPLKFASSCQSKVGDWIAAIGKEEAHIGNLAKKTDPFYFTHSVAAPPNTVIESICCEVEGLGIGENLFSDSRLIRRFLDTKHPFYGDVGAHFGLEGGRVVVQTVDPFFKPAVFKPGDRILSVDGKPYKDPLVLMQRIVLGKPSEVLRFEIERDGQKQNVSVPLQPRVGRWGKESFLEYWGVQLDERLQATRIAPHSPASAVGLKKGDRLMQIDFRDVAHYASVRQQLSSHKGKEEILLLFSRNDFQFFVKAKP